MKKGAFISKCSGIASPKRRQGKCIGCVECETAWFFSARRMEIKRFLYCSAQHILRIHVMYMHKTVGSVFQYRYVLRRTTFLIRLEGVLKIQRITDPRILARRIPEKRMKHGGSWQRNKPMSAGSCRFAAPRVGCFAVVARQASRQTGLRSAKRIRRNIAKVPGCRQARAVYLCVYMYTEYTTQRLQRAKGLPGLPFLQRTHAFLDRRMPFSPWCSCSHAPAAGRLHAAQATCVARVHA